MIKSSEYQKRYIRKHPWFTSFSGARRRCLSPKDKRYYRYGGRGIKILMTLKDFKYLWFRDKAYLMKKSSIDRINNDGNYEVNNCRFIEFTENNRKDRGTPVFCKDGKGNILHRFKSCTEAAGILNLGSFIDIYRAAQRKKEGSPGMSQGYYWEFIKKNISDER